MQMRKILRAHLSNQLAADAEVMRALEEFEKNIPGRVLALDVDETRTNKQGVLQGEKVYKFGVATEPPMAFVEYFEDKNQAEPTMALYVDKSKNFLTVKGWKVDKKFYLSYRVNERGKVEKISQLD